MASSHDIVPRRRSLPLLLLSAVVALVLVAAACGDDGGGGSSGDGGDGGDGGELSAEAFCAQLEEQEANEDLNLDDPEDLARFNALVDQAPEEIKGAMEELAAVTRQFEEFDENDPDAFGAVFALLGNPEFLGAVKDLSIFMADECGLEVEDIDEIRELDPEDPGALLEGFGAGPSDPGDGPAASDDDLSPSEQLEVFLEANYADTGWQDLVVGKAIGSFGQSADITVSLDTSGGAVPDADAVEACEAVVEWAEGAYTGDITVTITDFAGGDELATSADGRPCAVA